MPIKTVYDLLGVRPDADAEAIKQAFRKAAKRHHPDHHPGDPNAPSRFRRIAAAYAILRDANRRATYDRRLARERQRIRSRRMRMIVADASYVVLLVILFVWMDPILSASLRRDKIESRVARGWSEITAAPTAARDTAHDMPQYAARDAAQDMPQETPQAPDSLRDRINLIPDRSLEPGPDRVAADDVPDISKRRPDRRPLPNALGDNPPDRSSQLSAAR